MKPSKERVRGWHAAFASTMYAYEVARSRSECGKGLRLTGYTAGVVVPQVSDFVADVEITARNVLSPSDFAFFKTIYLDFIEADLHTRKSEKYQQTHDRVSSVLGRAYKARRIYPSRNYFKEVDKRK